MKIAQPIGLTGTAIAVGVAVIAGYSVQAWVRYGKVQPGRNPPDVLLDQFMPHPEVDEYHSVEVSAPADLALETAKATDIQSALPIKAIFFLRAIPALLRGEEFRPEGPRGLFEETLAQGFGVLAEEPGIAVVIGTYCQPWHQEVEFRPLPPEQFAAFDEPGFVKIAVSLAAEPLGPGRSRFVTRTRVATTDAEARRKFRLYWSPMSAGILLIRWFFLPLVRKQAERMATA